MSIRIDCAPGSPPPTAAIHASRISCVERGTSNRSIEPAAGTSNSGGISVPAANACRTRSTAASITWFAGSNSGANVSPGLAPTTWPSEPAQTARSKRTLSFTESP